MDDQSNDMSLAPQPEYQTPQEDQAPTSESEAKQDTWNKTVQEIRVLIDNQQVGGIIGKGGSNVKSVREGSGAFISILKAEFRNVQERVMVLKGTPPQIAKASQLIADLLINAKSASDRNNPAFQDPGVNAGSGFQQTSMRFLVQRTHVGAIIGKQGVVIKQTQNAAGARVQVSNDPLPNSTEKSVTITGSSAAIEAAALRILQQLGDNPLPSRIKNYPYVPGHHMMYSSPSPYMTPFASTHMQMGQVAQMAQMGQVAQMAQLAQMGQLGQMGQMGGLYTNAAMSPHPQMPGTYYPSSQKIAIPTICAGCVIGKRGAVIRELRSKSGTNISIADADPSTNPERIVTIYGSPHGIQMAVYSIKQLVEQYVPPTHHAQQQTQGQAPPSSHPPTGY